MSESLRKRTSKWDVVAEPQVPIEHTDVPSMKADDDSGLNPDLNSSKLDTNTFLVPSEMKADPTMLGDESSEADKLTEWPRREDDNVRLPNTCSPSPHFPTLPDMDTGNGDYLKHVYEDPLSGNHTTGKDEDFNRTRERWNKSPSPHFLYKEPLSGNHTTGKDEDFNRIGDRWNKSVEQNYGTSLSPHRDAWRQRSPAVLPKRSQSRSRSRSRKRSRSWSRSRSRTRSPSYGFRRGPERSRSRSPSYGSRRGPEKWPGRGRMGGGPAVACRDFAAGRCQRGNKCKFLHEDSGRRQSNRYYDGVASDTRESRAERGRYSRQGTRENFSDSREQSDYPRDTFSRNDRPTTRCYDFTKGRCQRGSECRYAHHEAFYDGGRGMRDEARAQTHDRRDADPYSGWRLDPPRRVVRDTPCKFFAEGRCRRGEACTFSHQVVWPHDDKSGYSMAIDSSNSSRNDLNQGDQPAMMDTSNSSLWMGNDNESKVDDSGFKPQNSQSQVPESNIHQSQTQEASNPLAVSSVAGQSFGQGGQNQYIASQPLQAQNFTPNIQVQQLIPPMPLNGQMQQTIFSIPRNGQGGQFIAPQAPSTFNVAMQTLPVLPPSHIGLSQQNYNLPPAPHSGQNQQNFNLSGQIQQNLFLPPLNGQNQQNFDFGGQGHQTLSPSKDGQNQNVASQPPNPESFNSNEQLMQRADASEKQPSQLDSDTLITQKVVTSEQAVQITNLSASLAQFFGNAGALNSQIATGLVPPVQPGLVPLIQPGLVPLVQPNQDSFTQQQANPTSGNMEPVSRETNHVPSGFEQEDPAIKEAQTDIDRSAPLSVTGGTDYGNPPTKSVDLEVKVMQGIEDTAAEEVNETETVHNKKELAENVEADVRTEGETKQSKDSKGMRMFKCALVDFVKDALKPSWKEGHLSKEAHKTIVKKVVEKVTGAMQSQNIPQTQEKIDTYMSNSKVKLTKLVQAYVEKYVKG